MKLWEMESDTDTTKKLSLYIDPPTQPLDECMMDIIKTQHRIWTHILYIPVAVITAPLAIERYY